jgi:hypothetical protein
VVKTYTAIAWGGSFGPLNPAFGIGPWVQSIPMPKPAPAPSRPRALTPSRPRALAPSRPHALTPSRPHALTPSRPHALTPSRPHALTPSRRHALTPSRPHAPTPSRPHALARALQYLVTPRSDCRREGLSRSGFQPTGRFIPMHTGQPAGRLHCSAYVAPGSNSRLIPAARRSRRRFLPHPPYSQPHSHLHPHPHPRTRPTPPETPSTDRKLVSTLKYCSCCVPSLTVSHSAPL